MKNKKVLVAFLVVILVLVLGGVFWFIKKGAQNKVIQKEESEEFSVPSNLKEYYQNAGKTESTPVPIKDLSDIDTLSDEIDSTTVDVDSDLNQLDKDFSSF